MGTIHFTEGEAKGRGHPGRHSELVSHRARTRTQGSTLQVASCNVSPHTPVTSDRRLPSVLVPLPPSTHPALHLELVSEEAV